MITKSFSQSGRVGTAFSCPPFNAFHRILIQSGSATVGKKRLAHPTWLHDHWGDRDVGGTGTLLTYQLIRGQGKKNGAQRIKEVNKLTASPPPMLCPWNKPFVQYQKDAIFYVPGNRDTFFTGLPIWHCVGQNTEHRVSRGHIKGIEKITFFFRKFRFHPMGGKLLP